VKGYFVTGTDTGVGKTVVSTLLAVGRKAHYWKPIQTGCREGRDADFVAKFLGREKVLAEAYAFAEPLSPHWAAEEEGAEIELARLARPLPPGTIIEGAGGALVPVRPGMLMVDLILALGAPALVVASTRLGTINHTLLTLEALRARGIEIAGVVTVGADCRGLRDTLEEYGGSRVLGHVPPCLSFSRSWFEHAYQQLSLSKEEIYA
jgi:dethiobiotin synthetase